MMKLIMPTNWDDELISEYKSMGITECYGKLALDILGGGRTGFILPNVSRKKIGRHVRGLHDAGIRFNYLLNASCTDFREFTRSGDRELRELLNWLMRIDTDTVTVTTPYLLEMIKKNYLRLKVCVSTNAEINSLQRALFWQNLGADQITLSHIAANRNFALLRLIRKSITCELRLIANTSCLFNCPLSRYHTSWDAHSSQVAYAHKAGFSMDYCNLFCKLIRFVDPVQFITSQWIRPEDVHVYEELGIDGMKLIDRRCTTEKLIEIGGAYARRSHEGNLIDLLPMFHGKAPLNKDTFFLKFRFFFHPRESNILKLFDLNNLVRDIDIYIDNKKLNNFISRFMSEECSLKDCAVCGYCSRVAQEVIRYDARYLENIIALHKKFLEEFVQGRLFHY